MLDRLFYRRRSKRLSAPILRPGLRAIADALDGGQLDGRHLNTIAMAGGRDDDRIHLHVSLDLAAPIVQRDAVEDVERGNLLAEVRSRVHCMA